MAYRRRRTNKRYGRRRRTYRRTFRRRNYSKPNKVYYFKRNFQFDNISIDHVNFFTIGYAFTLSKVPNYAEFQNLFDMYQIRAVKLTFRPEQSQSISLNDTANAQIYLELLKIMYHTKLLNKLKMDYYIVVNTKVVFAVLIVHILLLLLILSRS